MLIWIRFASARLSARGRHRHLARQNATNEPKPVQNGSWRGYRLLSNESKRTQRCQNGIRPDRGTSEVERTEPIVRTPGPRFANGGVRSPRAAQGGDATACQRTGRFISMDSRGRGVGASLAAGRPLPGMEPVEKRSNLPRVPIVAAQRVGWRDRADPAIRPDRRPVPRGRAAGSPDDRIRDALTGPDRRRRVLSLLSPLSSRTPIDHRRPSDPEGPARDVPGRPDLRGHRFRPSSVLHPSKAKGAA